ADPWAGGGAAHTAPAPGWATAPPPTGAATSTFGPPASPGWLPGGGTTPMPGGPGGPGAPSAPSARRRFAGLAALALVAALLGGGVALAGQQLLTRGTSLGGAVPAPGPGSTARPDGSIAKIAADALPSVVTIRIKTAQGNGTGSGFVIDNQGHILTNNHVVAAAGGNGGISAELNNGKTLPATVVGTDVSYDLAVIKVDATDLPPLQFGASKDVVVGDGVIAVGAPLGLDATVTSGIVSALNRPVTPGDGSDQSFINAIQTDAAINPGNSGGPLLDMSGRVIGINSAIARIPGSSSDSGGNIGVGFAIPSDQAAKTAQQLIKTGKADHPALGVCVDRSFTGDGAKIAAGGVKAGSSAEKAGLKEGDVVTSFEGKKVTDADALIVAVRAKSVGDTVTITVQRGNQTVDVSLALQSAQS
ncbi:MAG: trypsin-like peptidase domain-containing protein, partial [Lapillicoccus sp.]